MKKTLLILILISSFSQAQNSWTQKASMPNGGAAGAVGFSIGNYGYVCTGGDTSSFYSSGVWRYDESGNSWLQMSNAGTTGRIGAVGFSVNGFGYVCLGLDDAQNLLTDVWQYNPIGNTWVQKGNFPGAARMFSSAFVIGNKAYVTCGATDAGWASYTNDLWEYNPVTDSWTQKTNFPGAARGYAMAFSVGGKGYVGGGTPDDVFTFLNNYWQYDTAGAWTPIASFPGAARGGGVGFSIGNFGYVSTGFDDNIDYKDLWKYNPISNTWYQRTNFGGIARDGAISFVINNKAYVGTGEDFDVNLLSDLWMYTADSIVTDIEPRLSKENLIIIFPNPTSNVLNVECGKQNVELQIFNFSGEVVYSEKLKSESIYLNQPAGIYFVKVSDGEKTYTQKLVIQ